MTQSELEQIQQCVAILRETIEKVTGKTDVLVGWCAMENDTIARGCECGVTDEHLALILEMNKSFYDMFRSLDED